MDMVGEPKRITDISKLLDNRELKTDPFGHNVSAEQAYKRTEKIAAAIHLLTNHIPEDEPARKSARVCTGALLHAVLELRSGFRTSGGEVVRGSQAYIRELISTVRMMALSGYVSFQNTDIITEALDELGSFIASAQRSFLAESIPLSRADLIPAGDSREVRKKPSLSDKQTSITDIKDKGNSITDISRTKKTALVNKPTSLSNDAILEILKSGGMLNIKDISAHFPQYSEKTVQRALAYLSEAGLVRYDGAKRWRKYGISVKS